MADNGMTLAVLGCGFMGTALLQGFLSKIPPTENRIKRYIAAVRRPESEKRLQTTFSDHNSLVKIVCNDNASAVGVADTLILGCPPGDVQTVLRDPEVAQALAGKFIISIVAGVSCQTIMDLIEQPGKNSRVIRVIPSIGAQISESTSLVSESKLADADLDVVRWMFGSIGTTQFLPEKQLDAAVAVSATSHALVVTAIESIVDGSVSRGLPRATAQMIASQSFRGASSLLLERMTLESLKDSMSVPRGITTEAWIHLDAENIRRAISQAVRHAVDYAEKMA